MESAATRRLNAVSKRARVAKKRVDTRRTREKATNRADAPTPAPASAPKPAPKPPPKPVPADPEPPSLSPRWDPSASKPRRLSNEEARKSRARVLLAAMKSAEHRENAPEWI